jgi:hypothetical protein
MPFEYESVKKSTTGQGEAQDAFLHGKVHVGGRSQGKKNDRHPQGRRRSSNLQSTVRSAYYCKE